MARHQHQQAVRQRFAHCLESLQNLLLFAIMGAGGDPDAPVDAEAASQHLRLFAQAGGKTNVELGVAGYPNPVRAGPQRHQAHGILPGLRGNAADACQHLARGAGHTPIAGRRSL